MTNEELVSLIQNGERDRLHELWEQVSHFVAQKANKAACSLQGFGGVTYEDLFQCGYPALVEAAETYRQDAGLSFLGWLLYYLRREFAEATGCRKDRQRQDPLLRAVSLDAPIGEDEGGATLGDLQEDRCGAHALEEVDDAIWIQQLHADIERALQRLPETQSATIRARYYQDKTLGEIAKERGVYPETVRQWENKGLRKLRKPGISKELRAYIDFKTPYYAHTGLSAFRSQGSQPEQLTILRERWAERCSE